MLDIAAGVAVDIVHGAGSLAVLDFLGIRIGQSGLCEIPCLVPAVHHFQEFRCFFILVESIELRILLRRIEPQEIVGHGALHRILTVEVHEKVVYLRAGLIHVQRLHIRPGGLHIAQVFLQIIKVFHLSIPIGPLQNIRPEDRAIGGIGGQQGGDAVIVSVHRSLEQRGIRLALEVLRRVFGPQLIQVQKGALLR